MPKYTRSLHSHRSLPLPLKPMMKPPSLALFKILKRPFIAKIKRYGKRGSPCLKPLELWKQQDKKVWEKKGHLVTNP